MPQFMDFDKYIAEAKNEAPSILLYSETISLAPSLPVALVLFFKSLARKTKDENISDDEVFTMFDAIYTEERRLVWQNKGMDIKLMLDLVKWALEAYGVTNKALNAVKDDTEIAEDEESPKVKRGRTK